MVLDPLFYDFRFVPEAAQQTFKQRAETLLSAEYDLFEAARTAENGSASAPAGPQPTSANNSSTSALQSVLAALGPPPAKRRQMLDPSHQRR